MYIDQIRTSSYFTQDLGQSSTMYNNKTGDRELREGTFSTWYYNNYNSLVIKSGYIGPLHFYIDYYLNKNIMGFFLQEDMEKYQYAVEWEQEEIDKIGIDAWLGRKLKEVDQSVSDVVGKSSNDKTGSADKIRQNPGSVSWKDIEAHYKKLKSNQS